LKIKDWSSMGSRSALYRELKELDLIENIAELDAFGYTIIPPEKVGPPEQHENMKQAVMRVAASRKGCAINELSEFFSKGQELMRFILWDDPAFEKLILTPSVLGLVQWLVGTDCVLSLFDSWIKGKGALGTDIHTDWAQFDMPTMPPEAFGANFNYVLTDYTKEDGALSFVPGSHRWRRWPSHEEAAYWKNKAEPVEARAGSMIIWGDHLWHGSYNKDTEGLRIMILGMYSRPHMQTQEGFRETVTNEALARNPVRFTRLMNVYHSMPSGRSGRNAERASEAPRGYNSLFDTEPVGDRFRTEGERDLLSYDRDASNEQMKVQEELAATGKTWPDLYHG
jgi:ectoine hydroxylase-related dioxygenase (phytanoyl-CoA dioxygenase family)